MAMYQQMETGIQGHLLDSLYMSPAAVHMHIYRERDYIHVFSVANLVSQRGEQDEAAAVVC